MNEEYLNNAYGLMPKGQLITQKHLDSLFVDPFPTPLEGVKRPSNNRNRLLNWKLFCEEVNKGKVIYDFHDCYGVAENITGQYKDEAKTIWNFIQTVKPETIVEVGRNLGGNSFMMMCAGEEYGLKEVYSYDVYQWRPSDFLLQKFAYRNGMQFFPFVENSLNFKSPEIIVDFTYIDGGHTYDIVMADIENWRCKTRFIGFHDFADKGNNKHKVFYRGLVKAVQECADKYQWTPYLVRENSEIIFKTKI